MQLKNLFYRNRLSILLFFTLSGLLACGGQVEEKSEPEEVETEAIETDPVERIHQNVLTLDTHLDTPMRLGRDDFNIGERHDPRRGGGKVDFPRMTEGGLDAAFFVVYVPQEEITERNMEKAHENALETFDLIHEMVDEHSDWVGLALSPEDAYNLKEEGRHAAYIGLENGFALAYELSRVQEMYDLGARYIGLSHTRNNQFCDSSTDPEGALHGGLSDFGKEVVGEMNRIGMVIDVSHISDDAFWDVLEVSSDPVVATHSNARAVCDHPRNLSDEMIVALAENGGVIQITFLPAYVKTIQQSEEVVQARREVRQRYNNFQGLSEEEREEAWEAWSSITDEYPVILPTVSDFVDHIDYVVELVGIDHVGIGSDFDGGGVLEDCYDVSEMKNVTAELLNRGYSDEDIEKIWSGNFIRVFSEVHSGTGR